MKRQALFLALATLGLAFTASAFAQSSSSSDKKEAEIKALKALVEKQQQQLNQQQQDLASMHAALSQLENQQTQQQAQIQQTQKAQETLAATPPPAPVFTSAPGLSVSFHGFIDATAFSQTKNYTYGNGQNAEYPIPGSHGDLSGVDVRNTRFMFDLTGAKIAGNWTGGAHLEMDFFGGDNGTGAYSQQQPIPRLRQAYLVMENPVSGSSIRIGQFWDIMFPLDDLPQSLSHFAFPLGYGSGIIGWRYPGIIYSQDLNHGSQGVLWRLDLGAFSGNWNGPGSTTNYLTAGNAGFRPQIEAKLHAEVAKEWMAFLAAHYAQINLTGEGGTEPAPIKHQFSSVAYELGGAWTPGPWTFRGVGYTGKAIGQIFGDLSQFGDIRDKGGYVQGGYKFTPHWSTNLFYGISEPDSHDVIRWTNNGATGLLKVYSYASDVEYSVGSYAFALEWIHAVLNSTTNGTNRKTTSGNQVNLNAYYKL